VDESERQAELARLITRQLLDHTVERALGYLESLPERPVAARKGVEALRRTLGGPLPESGEEAIEVVRRLADGAEPGLMASAGPRYFGFVVGGSLPAALAADWLASAWDQNGALSVMSPALAVVEETAGRWLLDLFGLPETASVGFTTGAQMASFVGLAAARHAVLAREGWDVERRGLAGAPVIRLCVGEESHVTIRVALRMLGLGDETAQEVAVDAQGRMLPEALEAALATGSGPAIVCAEAGNVGSGAFDPLAEIGEICRRHGAWLHVDGAFGLWAAASPRFRELATGVQGADSWTTDAHKWLNVPYDCGIAIVADAEAHHAAMTSSASYLIRQEGDERDGFDWVPEASRRGRAFTVWAALAHLGRRGVAELVERCCDLASRMAERLAAHGGIEIMNDVVLNQVLVRFLGDSEESSDRLTDEVARRLQAEGTCWAGGSTWRGRRVLRISVSNWSTTENDIDRSAEAILGIWERIGGGVYA
jgi:glutamate/tyrosine decarboxylase-like PLP-dependent enzyme